MIVSHRHEFIFLKTTKTASTSVEVFLSQLAGDDAIVTPIWPSESGHRPRNYESATKGGDYPPHAVAEVVRWGLGERIWNDYFKFCFERNPWEKVVSRYWWRVRGLASRPSLEAFVGGGDGALRSDWPIYALGDEVAVDAIGRYESLTEDLCSIMGRLGLPAEIELPRAKSIPRPQEADERLSSASADLIRRAFHREVALFGYECPAKLLAGDGSHPARSGVA